MKKLLFTFVIASVVFITGCKKDEYQEKIGVCPEVISTIPARGAVNVPLNQIISATFNEKMNPATITRESFTLQQGATIIAGLKSAMVAIPVAGTVTYSGETATFTPSSPLIPNTLYTGRVTTAAKDPMGNALQADYVWTFNTDVSPKVISTDPANLATNVVLNKIVTATFSVPMDPLTITATTFTIKQGATPVAGVVSLNGSTASFTPSSALIPNILYTGTITTGAKNVAGTPLANNYIWTFTAGASPTVISTDPANLATGVVLNKIVTATFSVPMDPLTLTGTTFTINQGATPVTGIISYTGSTASFTPSSVLIPNTLYTGTITTGARNVAGIPLASNYVWTFTTGVSPTVISTDPTNLATGVALNKIVTAIFSVPMDPLTLTGTTFTIKQGATPVAGVVSLNGSTASFTPSSALIPNTLYTGTITTGAKNLAGTPLANNYVWTFTAGVSPSVTSTDPANNATGVVLDKTVTATFSVPMDPLTLTGTTFTIKQGATPVSGVVSLNGSTASFNPSDNLLPNAVYTATIAAGAKNLAGIPLAGNYVWTFTTGVSPSVTSTNPANDAKCVTLNQIITATFSVPMDPSSFNNTTFTLKQGATSVPGAVTYSGSTASFSPSGNLLQGTIYTATITTGVKNVSGIPLASNHVWTFNTGCATAPTVISNSPVNDATAVTLDKTVTATFSMPMDPLTLNGTTFTIKQGATSVAGVVSYSGTTASFDPSVNLLPNAVYTATITTGATNVPGTPLANDYVWTFTTVEQVVVSPVIDLKTAGRFGILAGVGVSNNAGPSVINNMDVGISPGARSSITGFPPATVIGGAIYAADDGGTIAAMLTQAKLDLTAAYLAAEGATAPAPDIVSGDQGGKTLAPGIYKSTSTLLIQSGDLTLDAQGDPNAVWIFQVASAFTTVGGAGGSVILTGGAQAKNIFWQTGSSAVIGDYTTFYGNVLALQSITMNSHATAVGRMLARNGAVVMTSTNTINKP